MITGASTCLHYRYHQGIRLEAGYATEAAAPSLMTTPLLVLALDAAEVDAGAKVVGQGATEVGGPQEGGQQQGADDNVDV